MLDEHTPQGNRSLPSAQALLRAQLEIAPDGILLVSPHGDVLFYNQRFAAMWGLPENVLAHASDGVLLQFVLPKLCDPEGFLARVQYLYGRSDEESREELLLTDGRVFERYSAPIHCEGAYHGRVWFFRDITVRRRAERDLQQVTERYLALVDSIEGIVWEVDASLRFVFVSKQAERLLGYPVERWLTEADFWVNHIHPEDRAWAPEFCLRASKEKRDHQFEYRMIAADGRVVWLRDLVTVIVQDDSTVSLRGIMVDVTQAKTTEAEVHALNRQLSERLEELEKFEEVVVGRELRMIELERRICELQQRLGHVDRPPAGLP